MAKKISPEDAALLAENISMLTRGYSERIDNMLTSLKVVKTVERELAAGISIEEAFDRTHLALKSQGISLSTDAIRLRYYKMLRPSK